MEIYHRRRQVHIFYVAFTLRLKKPQYDATTQVNLPKTNLYDAACKPWEGDNTSLQVELLNIVQYWPKIVPGGDRPPVQSSAEEVEDCLGRYKRQSETNEQMHKMCDFVGVDIEDDGFEEATQKAK